MLESKTVIVIFLEVDDRSISSQKCCHFRAWMTLQDLCFSGNELLRTCFVFVGVGARSSRAQLSSIYVIFFGHRPARSLSFFSLISFFFQGSEWNKIALMSTFFWFCIHFFAQFLWKSLKWLYLKAYSTFKACSSCNFRRRSEVPGKNFLKFCRFIASFVQNLSKTWKSPCEFTT